MPALHRRHFIAAAGAATAAGLVAVRPSDQGQPYDAYFARLNQVLKDAGVGTPTLVIDRARLRANAAHVQRHVQGRLALRLVNKSLPCLPLLAELAQITGTRRQMVFNLPYLQLLTRAQPQSDVLMGKPLPVAAAARFYTEGHSPDFDPARQLQWLIDTPTRLAQYRDLARARQLHLRVNIEIDIGLHRGGVADLDTLRTMVQMLQAEPLLQWSGLMGYDAHTEKIPEIGGLRERSRAQSKAHYQRFLDFLQGSPLRTPREQLTLNTAGSPSFKLHDGRGAANEVAVGSAMVKPTDFDTPLLTDLLPAAFIATPVLKSGPFVAPEGVEALSRLAGWWDPNQRHALFIYGGHWLARPESPAGLSTSGLIGLSSNQQILLGSGHQALRPDDFVFLRPTQSEAVLQQFGDIAVYDGGHLTERWPVFPAQA